MENASVWEAQKKDRQSFYDDPFCLFAFERGYFRQSCLFLLHEPAQRNEAQVGEEEQEEEHAYFHQHEGHELLH